MTRAIGLFLFLSLLTGCSSHYKPVTWEKFSPPKTPNYYLSCPKDSCNGYGAISPIFERSQADLFAHVQSVLKQQPRTEIQSINTQNFSLVAKQRSLLFRFPDIIQIKIITEGENQSSVYLYSQSVYGHYDFKVNKKRSEHWLLLFQNKP